MMNKHSQSILWASGFLLLFLLSFPFSSQGQELWPSDEASIDLKHQENAGEFLQTVPGVLEQGLGTLQSPFLAAMRGASSRQSLYLFEGTPLNSPLTGTVDLSTVSVHGVGGITAESVPVIQVQASPGGAFELSAKKPHDLFSFGDSFFVQDYKGLGFNVHQGVNLDFLQYNLQYSRFTSDGWTANSSVSRSQGNGYFGYDFDPEHNLSFCFDHFEDTKGDPGPSGQFQGVYPCRQNTDRADRMVLDYRAAVTSVWGADFKGFMNTNQNQDSNLGSVLLDSRDSLSGVIWQNQFNLNRNWEIEAGANLQQGWGHSTLLNTDQQQTAGDYSLGSRIVWQDNWTLKAEASNTLTDARRLGMENFSGLVQWGSENGIRTWFSAGRTLRPPTLLELYGSGTGNSQLLPEEAANAESGLEVQSGDWAFQPVLFGTQVTDYINQGPAGVYDNLGQEQWYGLEFQAIWKPNPQILVAGHEMWLKAQSKRPEQTDWTDLPYKPQASGAANLSVILEGAALTLEEQYVGSRQSETNQGLDNYGLTNLYLDYYGEQWGFFLNVFNLMDLRSYQISQGYDGEPRVYKGGVTWKF